MDIVKEPVQEWGGKWTETKLRAFESYVNAYLKIMINQKVKKGWLKNIIYFDGFAGSGNRNIKKENNQLMFFKNVSDEELSVYKGSAERVLSMEKKFDEYYFVDNDKNSIELLQDTLKKKNLILKNCNFVCKDVNEKIKEFVNKLTKETAALVFLDPFGMQINWQSIELLKDKRVDLWILIPSGVIVNRLLDKKGKLKFSEKLKSFFGMSKDEILNLFYEEKKAIKLFDDEEKTSKVDDGITKIAEVYIKNLQKMFKYVTKKSLILFNSKRVPIYHFVFASNNLTALKIANHIIERISDENYKN